MADQFKNKSSIPDNSREVLAQNLIVSGKYAALRTQLRERLSRDDWFKQIQELTIKALASTNGIPDIDRIVSSVETDAIGTFIGISNSRLMLTDSPGDSEY